MGEGGEERGRGHNVRAVGGTHRVRLDVLRGVRRHDGGSAGPAGASAGCRPRIVLGFGRSHGRLRTNKRTSFVSASNTPRQHGSSYDP